MLALLSIGMLTLGSSVHPVGAIGTIYIKPDGNIDPPSAPIQRKGNTYIFTGDIYESIVVQRNDIVIDGDEYALQGSGRGYGLDLSNRNNVTIEKTCIAGFEYGIYLADYSTGNSIRGNNTLENNGVGVYLSLSSNNSLQGNNFVNNGFGIVLFHSLNNSVYGNNMETNNWDGIQISDSSNHNSVTGNKIAYNRVGISHYNSSNNDICRNNLTKNMQGISLSNSSNNLIRENSIANSVLHGVGLERSDGNNITDNNIVETNYWGIELHHSDINTITDNNLMATINGSGILLGDSRTNKIYHNNFINNSISQAFVYGSYRTAWNNGYPSGGNYWSDYSGIDGLSGPDQDQPGSDGIGDTPYVIDFDNSDRYPLMSPLMLISGNLQLSEPTEGSVIIGQGTISFAIQNTGKSVEFLKGDVADRIDLEIEYRSAGGETYRWGIMLWSTSHCGLTLSSGEKFEQTLVYDPSRYEGDVPPGFIGEAPYGEATIRLVHWKSLEPGYWDVGEFGKAEIHVTFQQPAISAIIDFEPATLNLKSGGKWITVYTELPEGHNVSEIDISTVKLNGEIPAELHPTEIGDHDKDGISDLMVKFSRRDLVSTLSAGEVSLTITGEVNGRIFEGSCTIKVMERSKLSLI